MSEDTSPPDALINEFWQDEDTPTMFTPATSPEAKRELLRQIALSVFQRRRFVLAHELKATQVLQLIALVISKSYAGRGDSFQLADDEALMRISDLLLEHDPHIIQRYCHMQISEQQLLKQLKVNWVNIE